MPQLKTLILLKSVYHQNTEKVARAIADVLHADVRAPEDVPSRVVAEYDLFGFGSGVYFGRLHSALRSWVEALEPQVERRPAFIFSTAGSPTLHRLSHWGMKRRLSRARFDVVAEFNCAGYDTFGPLGLVGGLNRGHPNDLDLARAAAFARTLHSVLLQKLQRPDA